MNRLTISRIAELVRHIDIGGLLLALSLLLVLLLILLLTLLLLLPLPLNLALSLLLAITIVLFMATLSMWFSAIIVPRSVSPRRHHHDQTDSKQDDKVVPQS